MSRSQFGAFIPPVEVREIAGVPCLTESRFAQIPVRPNFTGDGTQVLPQICDRRPAPKPIAVINAVNHQARLEDQCVRIIGLCSGSVYSGMSSSF